MESRQIPPAQASARQTDMGASFDRTLFAALDAFEERKIPYCIIGGIAASGLGRPRSTHDIDFFVRPEDAEAALKALEMKGFETERTDERWLFKGWMEKMMVDVIFKSEGDIYFDDEMARHSHPIEYHGRVIPAVAPEDLIIIKCAVHSEIGPHHWHDALAVLSHAHVDWDYLLKRSRRAARRVLAVLIYAQSNDIWIPNYVITELFQSIFGENRAIFGSRSQGVATGTVSNGSSAGATATAPGAVAFGASRVGTAAPLAATTSPAVSSKNGSGAGAVSGDELAASVQKHMASGPHGEPDAYFIQKIREAIATDGRTAAPDIRIFVSGRSITAKGEVPSEEQRSSIETVIRDVVPGFSVDNQVRCCELSAPIGAEEVV